MDATNERKQKIYAVVLAAGKGTRMKSSVQKQYMPVHGRPILYYSLSAMQTHSQIDEIILVVGAGEEEYCRSRIVMPYGFTKVSRIVAGGAERYESVKNGLDAIGAETGYVLIHDGARPCLTAEIIDRAIDGARGYSACVAAMPVKDTIKIADGAHFTKETPDRSTLWQMQTPQSFSLAVIREAYRRAAAHKELKVTDDAQMVELYYPEVRVKLVEGAYTNIKVTTPEDIMLAEAFLKDRAEQI